MKARPIFDALIALSICLIAAAADAQTAPSIEPGARVRVTTTGPAASVAIARFQGFTDSTLVVSGNAAPNVIPLSAIQKLESSRRTPNLVTGAVGLLLGTALGGAAGCAANRDSYGVFCGGQSDTKVAVGAALGGITGAALGAYLFRRDHWSPVVIPR